MEAPLQREIQRMCDEAVLEKLSYDDNSPWASPTFAQPKKIGDIRILNDFHKMNQAIKKQALPPPLDWRNHSETGTLPLSNSIGLISRLLLHPNL